MKCKDCGGEAIFYDVVNRRLLYEDRKAVYISVNRHKCVLCGKIHRASYAEVVPHKHYARSIIFSESHNSVYPSAMTVYRWSQNLQVL